MKHFTLRLMLLSGIFMVFFAFNAKGQSTNLGCWDFEELCGHPEDAFHIGCIVNAQSASGSPDTKSDYVGISAFSGSKYAHMYAKYCYNGPGDQNRYHTEGILLRQFFTAGVKYRISFAVRSIGTQAPTETKVVLVNDMPNYGGIGIPGMGCLNTLDLLPNIPANSETIATYSAADISANGWEVKTIEWTPQSNFNQLWFRPKATSPAINGEVWTDLYLDNVCVSEICVPLAYNIELCQYPGSDQTVATITGDVLPHNYYRLYHAISCDGGPLFPNQGSNVPINWFPGTNSFTLPLNSGCYIFRFEYSAPGCHFQLYKRLFDTNSENIPLCEGPCDDWHVESGTKFCSEIYFRAVSEPDPNNFPPSAEFTFNLDGAVVQTGALSEYRAPLSGPNALSHGWHNICVTIDQEGCPPIEKCISIFNSCFVGPGNDRERTNEDTSLQISNPASGSIWMSEQIESGTANLYSLEGSLIKSFVLHGTDRLDVAELITGQYILAIQTQNISVSKLVFIQNQR